MAAAEPVRNGHNLVTRATAHDDNIAVCALTPPLSNPDVEYVVQVDVGQQRADTSKVLTKRWREDYDAARPHSSLGYRSPAPETRRPVPPTSAPLRRAAPLALA